MTISVVCPLCCLSVDSGGLEMHLRLELDYAPLACRLCRFTFAARDDALAHFEGIE